MKKELKYICKEKGITLIALVITIIVLLILAVVTIQTLTGDNGLLVKAKSAVEKNSQAEIEEELQLLEFEYEIDKKEGKYNDSYDSYVIYKKYGVKIGDIVNYDELSNGEKTYTTDTSKGIADTVGIKDETTGKYPLNEGTFKTQNLTWRVLGVNNKLQLELISENPTSDYGPYLANEEGYLYGPDELNKMCNDLYGKGNGAISARSLNVDDIDKLAGIKTDADKKLLDSGYGIMHQFRFPTEEEEEGERKLQERTNSGSGYGNWRNSHYANTYKLPGESEAISLENPGYSKELVQDYYKYTISEKVTQTTQDGKSMADIICKGTGNNNITQWLSSNCTVSYLWTTFRVRYIYNGTLDAEAVCTSSGNGAIRHPIRSVVTLVSNIKLSGSSEEGWTIQ